MRVLIFISSLQTIGGMERQALSLAGKLRMLGIEVAFLTWYKIRFSTRSRRELSRISADSGFTIYRFPMLHIKGISPLIFLIFGGYRLIRIGSKFDIIHAHQLHAAGLAAAFVRSFIRKPIIVKLTSAGPFGDVEHMRRRLPSWARRFFLKRVDRYIAITGEVEKELLALGIPARRIVRIPNGVDLVEFALLDDGGRKEARDSLGIGSEERLAVYVGSLRTKKRVGFLLKAWRTVIRSLPEARLLLLGGGLLMGELRTMAMDLDLAGSVSFLGWVKDIRPYLRSADLLVLPSVSEGLPNVVLQAFATGIPVVVTRSMGITEVVRDGVNGYLFEKDSIEELSNRMVDLFSDKERARNMGLAGRALMEQKFAIESVAEKYLALYKQLVEERRRD